MLSGRLAGGDGCRNPQTFRGASSGLGEAGDLSRLLCAFSWWTEPLERAIVTTTYLPHARSQTLPCSPPSAEDFLLRVEKRTPFEKLLRACPLRSLVTERERCAVQSLPPRPQAIRLHRFESSPSRGGDTSPTRRSRTIRWR